MTRFFLAKGNVQGVMFRQTLIRGAQKRNLKAGASNLSSGEEVAFALDGDDGTIDEMVETAKAMGALNSWGASIASLTEASDGQPVEAHQVHTSNVDGFHWTPNVEMYL